jgi:hypothetical protein
MNENNSGPRWDSSEIIIIESDQTFSTLSNLRAAYAYGKNTLYRTREDDDLTLPGMKSVYAGKYLGKMLIELALDDAIAYVDANINDTSMYETEDFWKDALYYAGRLVLPGQPYFLSGKIKGGKFTASITNRCIGNPIDCFFDIREERFYLKPNSLNGTHEPSMPATFSNFVYGKAKRFLLAQAQYDDGLIPEPYLKLYKEISQINKFLKGRKTVRADFSQGIKLICYHRKLQTAAFLIKLEKGRFVTNSYNFRYTDSKGNGIVVKDTKKLPCRFFQHKGEIQVDTGAFESVSFVPSDPAERQALERKQRISEIEEMILPGYRYSFDIIRLHYSYGGYDEIHTPETHETREEITSIPQVAKLVRCNCGYGKIRLTAWTYTIGNGAEAVPIPEAVFIKIQELGNKIRYRDLKGYTEQHERQYLLDSHFLYNFMGADRDDSELSNDIREKLVRNVLKESIPENAYCEYCVLSVSGAGYEQCFPVAGHIDSLPELLALPAIRLLLQGLDEDIDLCVMADNCRLGAGYLRDKLPDDLLAIMRQHGEAQLFSADKGSSQLAKRYYLNKFMLEGTWY